MANVAPKVLGVAAGALGAGAVGTTIIDVVKDTLGKDKGITEGLGLGNAGLMLGAGVGFVLLSQTNGLFKGAVMQRALAGSGLALIGGAVVGGFGGALPTFFNKHDAAHARDSAASQPERFPTIIPDTSAAVDGKNELALVELEGVELATAFITTKKNEEKRAPIYIDVATAVKQTGGMDAAIAAANVASKLDETDRSHAVIQAKDGAFWIARLSGDLDQIDGRFYTKDNEYNEQHSPRINRKQPSLVAVVGVEHVLDMSKMRIGGEPAAPAATPSPANRPAPAPEVTATAGGSR